jgi:hypothetical protein
MIGSRLWARIFRHNVRPSSSGMTMSSTTRSNCWFVMSSKARVPSGASVTR